MKKKHIYSFGIVLVLSLISVERIYYLQHRGFRISKIISPQPSIHIPPPESIDSLLDQPFYYLGGGGTSFAFLGKDGKTVLKLFKQHHLFYKNFLLYLTFPGFSDAWRIKKILSREEKHRHKRHPFFFASCQLAFQELKQETGLIYLCLQPNLHFNRQIKLIDAWGIPHNLNLSQTGFALQKKAQLLFPYLKELMSQGNNEEAKKAIYSLVCQILYRCEKQIGDRDPNLEINFGFIEAKAIEFDLGSFYLDPLINTPNQSNKELLIKTIDLQIWLRKHSPDLLDYLVELLLNPPLLETAADRVPLDLLRN